MTHPKPVKAPKVKVRVRKRKKGKRANLAREADRLFSLWIRARDGQRCRLCGSAERIQCAHLFSRRYRGARWNEANAWALCSKCHMRYTHRPLEWDDLLRSTLGEGAYWSLRRSAAVIHEQDLQIDIERLRLLLSGRSDVSQERRAIA